VATAKFLQETHDCYLTFWWEVLEGIPSQDSNTI
jgi:hypothetical protein